MIRNHVILFNSLERAKWLQTSPIRQDEHMTNRLIVVFDNLDLTSNHEVIILGRRADGTSLPKYPTSVKYDKDDIRLKKVVLDVDLLDVNGNLLLTKGATTYQFLFSTTYTHVEGNIQLALFIQHNFVVPGIPEPQFETLATAQFTLRVEAMPFSDLTYEGVIP